jgi:cytochrome c oxidase assembly protein subunit 15
LHRLAVLTCAATLALIFTGGLVTSTGSGLAVPDWPLSFGQLFPEMAGGVLFEHGHRMVAGSVALLTLLLAAWVVRREPRRGVRRLAVAALAAVAAQAVLGGVTVLMRLPVAVSVSHACLAQAFFCLTVALAIVTGRSWEMRPVERAAGTRPSPLFALCVACTAVVFAQLAIGATMRHMGAGLAIPDFPLSFGALLPPRWEAAILVNFLHRAGALLVTFVTLWVAARIETCRDADGALLRRPARLLAALVAIQVTLGALTVWSGRAVVPTTLHVAVGAAILGTCVALALRVWQAAAPEKQQAPSPQPARARKPGEGVRTALPGMETA